MLQFIESELKVKVALKGIRKIGDKIYWVELGSIDEKLKIMRNKSKLKNRRGGRIYINDDMTKQQLRREGVQNKTLNVKSQYEGNNKEGTRQVKEHKTTNNTKKSKTRKEQLLNVKEFKIGTWNIQGSNEATEL
ncbi:hypothetical protein QE152_g21931 [Popillia japonica]|uniref:Uncharacterized protein n=1 Tax=Popillia japonica TaxID=7064 RepID=A0AAW1KLW3_POPJA